MMEHQTQSLLIEKRELTARIAELEAERDARKVLLIALGDALCDAGIPVIGCGGLTLLEGVSQVIAENALLRKALEEIVEASRYAGWAASEKIGILAKAALARIPAANAL